MSEIVNPSSSTQQSFVNGSTSAPTRVAGTFAVIPEMTITMTTSGGDVMVTFNGSFTVNNGDSFDMAIFLDAAEVTGTRRRCDFFGGSLGAALNPANINSFPAGLQALNKPLAAGSHTFDVRWARVAGTARARGTERNLIAVELS